MKTERMDRDRGAAGGSSLEPLRAVALGAAGVEVALGAKVAPDARRAKR